MTSLLIGRLVRFRTGSENYGMLLLSCAKRTCIWENRLLWGADSLRGIQCLANVLVAVSRLRFACQAKGQHQVQAAGKAHLSELSWVHGASNAKSPGPLFFYPFVPFLL